jgi:cyclase
MKKIGLVVFVLLFSTLPRVHGQDTNPDRSDYLIDSLIIVTRLNEKMVLVSFGADVVAAISTTDGIAVIDAGISTGLTSKYRSIIEKEFHDKRFKYVIITHGHHDHTRGNSVFSDARIVGQQNTALEIERQNRNREKSAAGLKRIVDEYDLALKQCKPGTDDWYENFIQKYRCFLAWEDIRDSSLIIVPDMLFTDSLTISLADVTFELFYFGKCHSESDVMVFIPRMGLLFTGDLFMRYGRPSVNENLLHDKDRWKVSINWLEERMDKIQTVVTGHGRILGKEDLQSFTAIIMKE